MQTLCTTRSQYWCTALVTSLVHSVYYYHSHRNLAGALIPTLKTGHIKCPAFSYTFDYCLVLGFALEIPIFMHRYFWKIQICKYQLINCWLSQILYMRCLYLCLFRVQRLVLCLHAVCDTVFTKSTLFYYYLVKHPTNSFISKQATLSTALNLKPHHHV